MCNQIPVQSNEELPQSVLDAATREISFYSVGLISGQDQKGAGTLVKFDNKKGILTAYHVADEIRTRDAPIGIPLADYQHSFFIHPQHVSFVDVDIPEDPENAPELGPDLSFIEILSPTDIAIIESKKSFYPLQIRPCPYAPSQYGNHFWFVWGMPAALTEATDIQNVVDFGNIVMGTDYESVVVREPFDFITLRVRSGNMNFPAQFGGVSGGGFWIIPFSIVRGSGTRNNSIWGTNSDGGRLLSNCARKWFSINNWPRNGFNIPNFSPSHAK